MLTYKVWKINLCAQYIYIHFVCEKHFIRIYILLDVILIFSIYTQYQIIYTHCQHRTRGKRFHGWVGILFFRVYVHRRTAFVDLMWRILWFNFGLPNILSTISIRWTFCVCVCERKIVFHFPHVWRVLLSSLKFIACLAYK